MIIGSKLHINNWLTFSFILLILCVNCKKDNSDEIDVLIDKSKELIDSGRYLDASLAAKEALTKAQRSSNKQYLAKAWYQIAEAAYFSDNNSEAKDYYSRSILNASPGDYSLLSDAFRKKGLVFYYLGNIDSAFVSLNSATSIARKAGIYPVLSGIYRAKARVYRAIGESDSALVFLSKAWTIDSSANNEQGMAEIANQRAPIYFAKGNFKMALSEYNKRLEYDKSTGNLSDIAVTCMKIGDTYSNWGLLEKAIENLQFSLRLFEQMNDKSGIANCYSSIALCYEKMIEENLRYENIKNLEIAKTYHEKALEISQELGDSISISDTYINLGNVFSQINDEELYIRYGNMWEDSVSESQLKLTFKKALEYYLESEKIKEHIKDQNNLTSLQDNIGRVYQMSKQYDLAITYYKKSLEKATEIGQTYLIALVNNDLGNTYKNMKLYDEAIQYYKKSLVVSETGNYQYIMRYSYNCLAEIYKTKREFEQSLSNYEHFLALKDSISNNEKYKKIAQLEAVYENDKNLAAIQLLNKDKQIQDGQIEKQKFFLWLLALVVMLVVAVVFFVYRQFLEKKKANKLLEEKNHTISEQQNEIKQSIVYASRIQGTLLPSKSKLNRLLQEHFIFYQPRDIVSGDFFWMAEHDHKVILAVADCTGHGVPGAFMSILGITSLNEIMLRHKTIQAHEILNSLRTAIIKSFTTEGSLEVAKDGMDISLLIIDYKNKTIEFAGAYNPLVLIRKGEIIEIEADRMPVGMYDKVDIPFKSQLVELQTGDMLYAFSDGYEDQFGGPSGKKFMKKNLKNLFATISTESAEEQYNIIKKTFTEWKDKIEQIDDVTIVGLRM
jgi:serine phosphatase RsbU (regulator of sigma subunit)